MRTSLIVLIEDWSQCSPDPFLYLSNAGSIREDTDGLNYRKILPLKVLSTKRACSCEAKSAAGQKLQIPVVGGCAFQSVLAYPPTGDCGPALKSLLPEARGN